ncbi:EutN/CcmL family microcompartment protein [Pelagicoccus sp. SDUM812003]|uniref:EutN/CcmL family microcompartment protein n=1 Tax=Pelagicoccus sp. SDUM812003 TaxID=3041267 RepID=UPI00280E090A|nr:EutN/CcmL family microcompartment protein [Pelagicoccus sp. SDUM812003]MDQ8204638.1 EutN/CcmL family microcompartment protein [Pelagicoccus sp. SDUM812003]
MNLARVDGNVTTTVCHRSLQGWRLLICQPVDGDGVASGDPILAVDTLGAGFGQIVMLTSDGLNTRKVVGDDHSPLRYTVLAIVDDKEEAERAS